ncbi:MAG: hypothetical protein HC907_28435 [Richelia sp. SM1_7_0]|nr:hypothetical protein [Richelia sp. SM2_1_7]NJM22357.1 hypothetical protein [Richelia sp. SM1_7_0]
MVVKQLFLCDRQELITQAANKLEAVAGTEVGIIKAGHKPNPDCLLQVGVKVSLERKTGLSLKVLLHLCFC